MARSSFRARSLLTSCLVSVPAAAVLFVACGNQQATAPPAGTGHDNFGDGSTSKPDAKTPPKDAGKPHDAGKDTAADVGAGDATMEASGAGTPCTRPTDCASMVCEPVKLVGTQDGEVFFDAGVCDKVGSVCQCQSSTCTDGVKNGHETGVDCGGGACPPCAVGSTCHTGTDCTQAECGVGFKGATCTTATPDSGVDPCVCEMPTCTDGVKNQDETDIDCGGATCQKCPTGKACKAVSDCSSDVCTGNLCACPPGMTEAPTSVSVPYCIDTYEITYLQYSTFIGSANAATIAAQPAECAWNTTFIPSGDWPQPAGLDKNPVNYVNWCDALAYCSSVGHHLCGAIASIPAGTPGGAPVPLAMKTQFQDASVLEANDPSIDEWYNACSGQGQTTYPYGNTYQPGWCNGVDSPAQALPGNNGQGVEVPPGSLGYTVDVIDGSATCILQVGCGTQQTGVLSTVAQGQIVSCKLLPPNPPPMPMPQCGSAFMEVGCYGGSSTNTIYDLSGNVAEWENSCSGSAGQADSCAVRGGAYDSPSGSASLTCASSAAQPPQLRNTQAADIGFRCCL